MNQRRGGSLRRGLTLLTCLGQASRPLGLSELAATSGMDKATTYRLAQTLVDTGFLTQDAATRSYSLALKILDLGFATLASMDVRTLALPYMRELADQFDGASVSLTVLDGADVLYIERISQRRISMNVDVQVGSRAPGALLLDGQGAAGGAAARRGAGEDRAASARADDTDDHHVPGRARGRAQPDRRRRLRRQRRGDGAWAALTGRGGPRCRRPPGRGDQCRRVRRGDLLADLVAATSAAVVDAAACVSRHLGLRDDTGQPADRGRATG